MESCQFEESWVSFWQIFLRPELNFYMGQMMLFSSFQNSEFTSVDWQTVIAVRHCDPTFGTDLDVELIQADDADKNHWVCDLVNSRGKNYILTRTVKIHNEPLVDSSNL